MENNFNDENIGNIKRGFAYWEVNGESYKLKLKTSGICELEKKYNTSLFNLVSQGNMPSLSIMLDITHAAMKEWQHGVKLSDVQNLFDKYKDEGGSQLQFFTDVYMKIFVVSGFFPQKMAEEMETTLSDTTEKITE